MNAYKRKDLRNIVILISLSLLIGIYLIATTVVISKDGVKYIGCSQALSSNFNELIKKTPPIGYSLLIVGFHQVYSALYNAADPASWIVSAQICTLTCKTLAMVSLYFFGRCFFPRKHVFTSLLIVSFLPYPTQFGVDVLRDWPHVLFLFTAMLFLIKGIRQSSWMYMALAGLTSGLGQIIRPECTQVILYGIAIFTWQLYRCLFKKTPFPKKHIYLFLLAGFLLIFIPYSHQRGKIIPGKLKSLFSTRQYPCHDENVHAASSGNASLFEAGLTLTETVGENFHYYFFIPAGIGLYLRFSRKKIRFCERTLLVGLFIGFNCLILLLLHSRWGYISRRHALPLCMLLTFYVPFGIEVMAIWIAKRMKDWKWSLKRWASILVLTGIMICLPKALSPLGQDKKIYLEAVHWIETSASPGDCILTFDPRIPFYAREKNWKPYNKKNRLKYKPAYLICVTKNGVPDIDLPAQYVLMETFKDPQKDKDIQIFRRQE